MAKARARDGGPRRRAARRGRLASASTSAPSRDRGRLRCLGRHPRERGRAPRTVEGYLDEGYRGSSSRSSRAGTSSPCAPCASGSATSCFQVDANTAYTRADAEPPGAARRVRPAADRAAAAGGRRPRPRRARAGRQHADLPRRVDHLGARGRGRDRARRVPHRQHQARPGRRLPRGAAHPRRVRGERRAGVVRRHARDRPRPRRQRRARRAPRLHAARRHVGVGPLLRRGHHRAVRAAATGDLPVPTGPGLGVTPIPDVLERVHDVCRREA